MNSEYHIDTQNRSDYSLPAGLHCQSVLADRLQKAHNNAVLVFVRSLKSRLYGEARRDTFGCAGFLLYQSANPSSLATII
ncbi:hypothetical protein MWMV8_MWMV8_01138 [Acinetobacter calcoaceticus]|nr:hypothetical protein MWMV8_MWMV8_01138 [Acinetobacter calcoaceticus]